MKTFRICSHKYDCSTELIKKFNKDICVFYPIVDNEAKYVVTFKICSMYDIANRSADIFFRPPLNYNQKIKYIKASIYNYKEKSSLLHGHMGDCVFSDYLYDFRTCDNRDMRVDGMSYNDLLVYFPFMIERLFDDYKDLEKQHASEQALNSIAASWNGNIEDIAISDRKQKEISCETYQSISPDSIKGKFIFLGIEGILSDHRFNDYAWVKDDSRNDQNRAEIPEQIFLFGRPRPLTSVINKILQACSDFSTKIGICEEVISPFELRNMAIWVKGYCPTFSRANSIHKSFWFVPDNYWESFWNELIDEFTFDSFPTNFDSLIINNEPINKELIATIIDTSDIVESSYGYIMKGTKDRILDWLENNARQSILDKAVFIDNSLPYLEHAQKRGFLAYHISGFID